MKDSFLRKTAEIWQPLSDETLTEEDAREIIQNITGFFDTLARWDRESSHRQKICQSNEESDRDT